VLSSLRRRLLRDLLPFPVSARHIEYSLLVSLDDEPAQPSQRLLDISLRGVEAARTVDLAGISDRVVRGPRYPDVWPGEHYRLLAGLVHVLEPKLVVEIGTFTGLSALALMHRLPRDGRVVTFDVLPWETFEETTLKPADFADGRLEQIVDDVTHPEGVARHRDLLARADLIFVDAAKDGEMETRLLRNLDSLAFAHCPLVVFDDIRLWNMLAIWRSIPRPKLDLTSYGHWTGTGLVDWTP
jgi:predicted O-methyltransferase YrrM